MKHVLSALAVCVIISMASCGGESGSSSCSGDYIGSWSGNVTCSGQQGDSIFVAINEMSGDTLAINSNGEDFLGVLTGCDLALIPVVKEVPIFGNINISGTFEVVGDDLRFTQVRASGGEEETCTFIGQK